MSAKGNRYCKETLQSKTCPYISHNTRIPKIIINNTTTQSSFSQGLKAAAQSDTLLSKLAALMPASFVVLSSSFVNVSVLFSRLHFENRQHIC